MLADWFKKKEASRKYVDLIKQTSSKWANWDPPLCINAGDFGGINYNSGQFEREGNIYTHSSTASIAAPFPSKNLPTEKEYVAGSINSRKGKFDANAHADVHGIANAAFATQWHFDKTRGALLVMHKPRMSVVPDEFCDVTISNEFLKGKMLVTQVFSCHAYAMYLSNKNNETVKIALKADAASNPAGSAGVDADAMWWTDGDSGLFRKGFSQEESFTPLYLIKMIKPPPPRRREKFDPNAPKGDRWAQIDVPWGHLEDDGDEEQEGEITDSE